MFFLHGLPAKWKYNVVFFSILYSLHFDGIIWVILTKYKHVKKIFTQNNNVSCFLKNQFHETLATLKEEIYFKTPQHSKVRLILTEVSLPFSITYYLLPLKSENNTSANSALHPLQKTRKSLSTLLKCTKDTNAEVLHHHLKFLMFVT